MWKLPSERERPARQRLAIALPALSVAMIAGWMLLTGDAPSSGEYRVHEVRAEPLTDTVRVAGKMEPARPVKLTAKRVGTVDRINVREGDRVEKGETLFVLRNSEAAWQARQSRFDREQAELNLTLKQETLKRELQDMRARREELVLQRQEKQLELQAKRRLYEDNIISRLDYRRAEFAVDKLEQQLQASRERVDSFRRSIESELSALQHKLELKTERAELDRERLAALEVRSPVDGTVKGLTVTRGSYARAGDVLAEIFSRRHLVPRIRLPESYADTVGVGQDVLVETSEGGVPGRIQRLEPEVSDGYVGAVVDSARPLPETFNRPNRSFEAEVILARLDETLVMDRPSSLPSGTTMIAFRIDEERRIAHRTKLRIGIRTLSEVQVVSGAQPGDRLIVDQPDAWRQRSKVELEVAR